jgi:hypothetical protein
MSPQLKALEQLYAVIGRIAADRDMPTAVLEAAMECWLGRDLRHLRPLVEALPEGTSHRQDLIEAIVAALNAGE